MLIFTIAIAMLTRSVRKHQISGLLLWTNTVIENQTGIHAGQIS